MPGLCEGCPTAGMEADGEILGRAGTEARSLVLLPSLLQDGQGWWCCEPGFEVRGFVIVAGDKAKVGWIYWTIALLGHVFLVESSRLPSSCTQTQRTGRYSPCRDGLI